MNGMDEINAAIKQGAPMTLPQILREEIDEFKASEVCENIKTAEKYYRNRSDVQNKENSIKKRSNTKIEHPILKKLIEQKVNYLLAKPFTVESDNKAYSAALSGFFTKRFRQKIKNLGRNAVKTGIAYLAPYIGEKGVEFMALPAGEVKPLWSDDEHSALNGYIRFYTAVEYMGQEKKTVEKVEYWDRGGVKKFRADHLGGVLKPDCDETGTFEYAHIYIDGQPHNWDKIPLIWCKYNDEELPLCYFVKELIDDINWQTSVTADVLRDVAKVVYVLKGYGGENLGQFVENLKNALAIEVAADGGVDTLAPKVDVEAVMAFLEKNRRDLYDLAAAVDTKDPELGNASGTAINFRYMDLDADCNNLAAELQEAFENMKPFIDFGLNVSGKGDFSVETFEIVFNSDMPVNETEIINNINNSAELLSRRTRLAMHPYVKDVEKELAAVEAEREKELEEYGAGGLFAATAFEKKNKAVR